jgi:hypothetical protein
MSKVNQFVLTMIGLLLIAGGGVQAATAYNYDFNDSSQASDFTFTNNDDSTPWEATGGVGDSGAVAIDQHLHGPLVSIESVESIVQPGTTVSWSFLCVSDDNNNSTRLIMNFDGMGVRRDGGWAKIGAWNGTLNQNTVIANNWFTYSMTVSDTGTVDIYDERQSAYLVEDGEFGITSPVNFKMQTWGDTRVLIDNITVTPEPATMGLLSIGGLGMLLRRKRK